jgi:hypothetical protein
MAKNKVSEWSSTASNNTDIGGINIAEGCAPSGINNAIRELMAQVKDMQTGSDSDNLVVGGSFTCSGPAVFSSTVSLGSALPVTSGGTGVSSVTTGDILYASAVNTISKLSGAGTTGQVLLSGTAPSWGKVALNSAISGTLPVANGGTGATTLTSKGVLIGNGTSTVTSVSPGTDDNVLMSDGTSWTSAAISTISSFANSLGTSGYQKLPGGLIIQWGSTTESGDTVNTVTFPTSFSSAVYAIVCSHKYNSQPTGGSTANNILVYPKSNTQFDYVRDGSVTNSGIFWIAIGV